MTREEAMTQPTCKTCKWWKPPSSPPPGWGGHVNEYGICRHFANDRFMALAGHASAVRCATEPRAEHTCGEHQPKDTSNEDH
jgi:hypothetical protein